MVEPRPLLFIHPASGDSAAYAALAALLDWPGPIFGIDAAGLRPDDPIAPPTPSPTALADIARDYLRCWREQECSAQGHPRHILGWSVGGVIAAEMSQQLVEAGEPVEFLGLFDCRAPIPEMRHRPSDDITLARLFALTTARVRGRELAVPPADASPTAILACLRDAGAAPADWTVHDVARRVSVGARLARALFTHDQRRLSTRVHLFEADSEHPQHPRPATLGWEQHAADVVRIPVPGTHFTLMSDANAPRLAELVTRHLRGRL